MKHLVVVLGPTAVGKTACALALARHFQSEIISADARQLYREMTIGTAKPSVEERRMVPHHLVDCLSITARYSAACFEREALARLEVLWKQHDVVLIVGGSGLYIDAVCEGLAPMPDLPAAVRQAVLAQYAAEGLAGLCATLAVLDPAYYAVVDRANPHRLMRAIGVSRVAGVPYTSLLRRGGRRAFRVIKIGLTQPRELLYRRIGARVDAMVAAGLVTEARALYAAPHVAERTIGYRELFCCFSGHCSQEEAVEQIKRNTRRYAKRQMTWFRRDAGTLWCAPEEVAVMQRHIERCMQA